jgi:WD40 repeat protein
LATAGADGIAIVWDAQASPGDNRTGLRFAGHTAPLSSVAFSPAGARLATSSGDKTAKVWDAASGQELLTFGGNEAALVGAVFSPDGRHLATTSVDGTVRVYTLDVEELTALAQARITRLLTGEECTKYLHFENCPALP